MKIHISHVQHFSIGDGDGIRTTVFFKGCSLRCPWCHNPESLSFEPTVLRYKTTGETDIRGKTVDTSDLLPELLEDAEFFRESGGGVTLSGGEALLQADGAAELARLLLERGVNTWIDTAGCVPYKAFETVNPFVDAYLFDVKTADPAQYAAIGGNLQTVTDNLRRLLADGKRVHVRIPLIPQFNTDPLSIEQLCSLLSQMSVSAVELLPFHRLGSAKYEAMGLSYAYKNQEPLTSEQLKQIQAQYETHFNVIIE